MQMLQPPAWAIEEARDRLWSKEASWQEITELAWSIVRDRDEDQGPDEEDDEDDEEW